MHIKREHNKNLKNAYSSHIKLFIENSINHKKEKNINRFDVYIAIAIVALSQILSKTRATKLSHVKRVAKQLYLLVCYFD